ncbi:MAG: hypothetical protein ACP5O2_05730 [Bacteroidales bacterium]
MSEPPIAVRVDKEQCQLLGQVLRSYAFKENFYKRPFLTAELPEELKLRMYLFSVGICHQTWNLAHQAANLYGWDYLEDGFLRMFEEKSWLTDTFRVAEASSQTIAEALASYFVPFGSSVSTLDRLEERASLYRDMAEKLVTSYKGQVSCLLQESQGRVGGMGGLYSLLSAFEAYSDPLHKKSSFLVKLLADAGLWQVQDPENLVPVMDYHMQRVLLRSGAVEVVDPELRNALINRWELTDDTRVRKACIEASSCMAEAAGLGVLQMNDVLYMLGRSCCFEEPLCRSGRCAKNPCSLVRTLEIADHTQCIFSGVCRGSVSEEYINLWNPVVKTHYY